jgi:hypothetical protein
MIARCSRRARGGRGRSIVSPSAVDDEVDRGESKHLPERCADVRAEPQPALPLTIGRGHDPCVQTRPGRHDEWAASVRRGLSLTTPLGHPEVDRPRRAVSDRIDGTAQAADPEAGRQGVAVPAGTMANGIDLPARIPAACRTVPSPPTTATSGDSVSASSAEPAASWVSSTIAGFRPVRASTADATTSTKARRRSGSRMRDAPRLMTSCGAVASMSDGGGMGCRSYAGMTPTQRIDRRR